jgi:hypothetical protein
MNVRVSLFLVMVLLLCACAGGSGGGNTIGAPSILGKWTYVDDPQREDWSDCIQILSGLDGIEFLKDNTALKFYRDAPNIPPVSGKYSLIEGQRIKIEYAFVTEVFEYSFSGNDLKLCKGDSCCTFPRQ